MAVPAGSIRFNTDSNKMEIYDGNAWWNIDSTSPEEQTGGTRALNGGGATPSGTINTIEYANIETTGNFADFGDLTAGRNELKACASRTRALFGGGALSPSDRNDIYKVTIATTGDSSSFGNLVANTSEHAALSNETRGIWAGGKPSGTDTIQYVTISSESNAVDFGDLAYNDAVGAMGAASPLSLIHI